MTQGRELNAMFFLEGRSIPFAGAICQFQMGQPGTASIEVPPLPEIRKILPRTMAHLFVKDFSFPGSEKPWVLLFEGEIYGYGQQKTPQGRAFTLFAMDYSNYWDNAKQFYMHTPTSFGDELSTLNASRDARAARKDGYQIVNSITGVSSYISKLMSDTLNSGGDFVKAVTDIAKGVEDINPFFRYSNYRYRTNDRILFQSSQNIKELFDFAKKEGLWEQLAGAGNGGIRTIRQVMTELAGLVFHDQISVPCPSKVSTELNSGIGVKNKQTIGSFIFKPECFMVPPPKCNVIFPDQYNSFNFTRVFFSEVTRLKFYPNLTAGTAAQGDLNVFSTPYYSPSGFREFRGGEAAAEGEQYEKAGEQGEWGQKADGLATTSVLTDSNFLSYEEVLKGIFSDMGNVMPSAQAFARVAKFENRGAYFQQATDYLFYLKRYASRAGSASGPLNLSVVPGFNALFLDDSAGEQNIIGILTGVSHSISATGGGVTTYQVGFARNVDEEDFWGADLAEPPIPPWYDPSVFGRSRPVTENDYKNLPKEFQPRVKAFKTVLGFEGTSLKQYYLGLLGNTNADSHLGSEPIVSEKYPNMIAATYGLVAEYRAAKSAGNVTTYINKTTRRDYVTLTENFRFLGAQIKAGQTDFMRSGDITFSGPVFDGGFVDKAGAKENARDRALKPIFGTEAIKRRRGKITPYRNRLLTERGFRG